LEEDIEFPVCDWVLFVESKAMIKKQKAQQTLFGNWETKKENFLRQKENALIPC